MCLLLDYYYYYYHQWHGHFSRIAGRRNRRWFDGPILIMIGSTCSAPFFRPVLSPIIRVLHDDFLVSLFCEWFLLL